MKSLRDHQIAAHEGLRAGFRQGMRRGLLQMPTGGGKTITALEMLRLAVAQNRRGLFLCDRRSLVLQAAREAREYGVPCGVLMAGAGYLRDYSAPVQFASKDSLLSWHARPDFSLPPADLIITDECHRSAADTWRALLAGYPKAWEVGLTATPSRSDGKGLGSRYDFLVSPTSYSTLISSGVLCPATCFAPGTKPIRGAGKPTRKGMVGDVVGWWKRLAEGRRTFVFASSVAHSLDLVRQFKEADVAVEHLDGNTDDEEREACLGKGGRLATGNTLVVCSCSVLKYGIDCPSVDCIQIVDGFGSLVDYLQAVGRGLRSSPNKSDCVVIDHSGVVLYHGFPDADRAWVLEGERDVGAVIPHPTGGNARPVVCPKCTAVFAGRPECPVCGHKLTAREAREVGQRTGTLHRVERDGSPQVLSATDYRKGWASCVAAAMHRGMTLAAAASHFKSKYGATPWSAKAEPLPPPGYNWHQPARAWWDKAFKKNNVR